MVKKMKQVIVMRADLKMSKGKLAAQACHASLGSYQRADEKVIREWDLEGGKKVVVGVKSQEELFRSIRTGQSCWNPQFLG